MNSVEKVTVRAFASIGLLISSYLFWLKLSGEITSIAGCGSGSGCANVLGSRWSQIFTIPVSALSTVLYAGILVLSVRPHRLFLQGAAFLLLGAAIWFMGLQAVHLKTFCPWCLATHLVGVATGITLLLSLKKENSSPLHTPLGFASIGLFVLIMGQLFGPMPDTHLITEEELGTPESHLPYPTAPESSERMVTLPGSSAQIPLSKLPHIGPEGAPHILIKYFDYTCGSCRDMHGDLHKLQVTYPEQITVIHLPVPLNRTCNPHLSSRVRDHEHACELARLSLAAWLAKPELFEQFHSELFARPVLSGEAARRLLEKSIPKAELDAALANPWIEERIIAHTEAYSTMTIATDRMPKLVLDETSVMHGISKSTDAFIKTISGKLGL